MAKRVPDGKIVQLKVQAVDVPEGLASEIVSINVTIGKRARRQEQAVQQAPFCLAAIHTWLGPCMLLAAYPPSAGWWWCLEISGSSANTVRVQ